MASRPTFFMKRSDRLVARLRHMLHGLRFSKQVGGQLIFVWTPLPEWFQQFDSKQYHVEHIFDVREHYARGGSESLIFYDSVAPFPTDVLSLQSPEFAVSRAHGFDRDYFLTTAPVVYSGVYMGFQFSDEGKTPAQLNQEVRELYATIPMNPVASRILNTAKTRMNVDRYSALHVRKGDVGEMMRRDLPSLVDGSIEPKALSLTVGHYLGRTAPFDFYYPHIERCIANGERILFTSDSPETITHFAQRFGPKHFVDINRFVRARYPLQKAFLDFNILVGAEKIISTGSTYAAFASELGGGELINVARAGSIERLVQFAIEEYAPGLEGNTKVREALTAEITVIFRAKGRKAT